jgi:hypothetical protein
MPVKILRSKVLHDPLSDPAWSPGGALVESGVFTKAWNGPKRFGKAFVVVGQLLPGGVRQGGGSVVAAKPIMLRGSVAPAQQPRPQS